VIVDLCRRKLVVPWIHSIPAVMIDSYHPTREGDFVEAQDRLTCRPIARY
jgi:hypothetical protein